MSFNHSTLVPWPWALESFDDPAAMMTQPLGEPVLDEPGRQVRRIVFDDYGRCLYLKRQREPRPWRQLPMLLRAARPHTAAGREATMIAALRAADMPVARVVSWGQRRVLGVPIEGYILTEAVHGPSLAQALAEAAPAERRRLFGDAGRLMGRLHAAGFFHIVRTKDVIVADQTNADEPLWSAGDLVLIDREVHSPWAKRFTRRRCLHSLARCRAKHDRGGDVITLRELATFCKAYRQALKPRWAVSTRQLIRGVERHLRRIRKHRRYR